MRTLESLLKKHNYDFFGVVAFDPAQEKLARLDLTKNNATLTEEIYSDTKMFSTYVDAKRKEAGAKFLIGGYGELRDMYKRSFLFDLEKRYDVDKPSVNEPRRLHLGMDIWGEERTPVHAPLGGMVHSFANNSTFGDYGATIILQHQLDTVNFYTLYGHLSLADIKPLRKGQFITRKQCFGHFGNDFENGNWPPHLHFQVIVDIGLYEGDYPGVCKLSAKEKYMANSPDADLVLQLNRYL